MNFCQLSDGIRLHHQPHDGHGGHGAPVPGWLDSYSTIDSGDSSAGEGGNGFFSGLEVNAPVATFSPLDAARAGIHGEADAHQSNIVQIDQHAVQVAGIGGNGGNNNVAAGGNISALESKSGPAHAWLGSGMIDSGTNTAGNGGDGYFYGGIIHASMVVYEPINISVAVGYGSIADADQTNSVNFNQSAVQMAGIGGNGGDGNTASGGNVGISTAGTDVIATGGNSAGNGGHGIFSGTLVDAPVVIYHPINIAVGGTGGTAEASQSNTVDINQAVIQIAGIGGNGGNGNAAIGGEVSTLGSGSASGGWEIQSGGSHAGNGGDGYAYGGLVHASFALYDPINIAVAGYNSSANAIQTNNVHLDQSSSQMAGVGGHGGSGNVAMGGNGSILFSGLGGLFSGLGGGSDAIATGSNGAGNGGSGHFSGSLVDVSVAIYAPINIAIAGPHSTAEADQVNNVHIDQSAIQMAGISGNGGHGNVALGGDVAMHLLSDLHLMS
jgi:hypothetical protein